MSQYNISKRRKKNHLKVPVKEGGGGVSGYPYNIFLLFSSGKHMLWVLNRSASVNTSVRHF